MHIGHDIAFIQSRVQARHGARLSESDWLSLRNNRSLRLYLDSVNLTELKSWTQKLHANMKPHTIERLLRAAWRDYILEVSNWSAPKWRPAIQWMSHLPDLPIIDHILHGGVAPKWLRRDPNLAGMTFLNRNSDEDASAKFNMAPIMDMSDPDILIRRRWSKEFENLWPADEQDYLTVLEKSLDQLFKRFELAGAEIKLEDRLMDLNHGLARLFRRYALSPLVLFAHLGIVAIDLLRLRGDLLQRCLFAENSAGGPL